MISRSGMLAPLVAVLVWADRKLNIGGRGGMVFPAGPQMNCSRRGHRQPGIRLTGVRRAPYSIRARLLKAWSEGTRQRAGGAMFRPAIVPPLDASGRLGQGLRIQGVSRRGALHARRWHR